jgi:Fe-S cluster assembly scaffold protein SufB
MRDLQKILELAKNALNKPPKYGLNIDFSEYSRIPSSSINSIEQIENEAYNVGIDLNIEKAGTYIQLDHKPFYENISKIYEGKIEVMSVKEAFKKHDWLLDYFWETIRPDMDKFTARAAIEWDDGYFFRIMPNVKVTLPIQSCMLIGSKSFNQNVHNIVIAEENSEVQVLSGCTAHRLIEKALHIGITEFYIKNNAKLTFTMIHKWPSKADVRPRSGAIIENNGTFISNYILIGEVNSLQTFPIAYLKGKNSKVEFNSILNIWGKSLIDVGSEINLEGEKSSGRILTRAIVNDEAQIFARGKIIGLGEKTKGHMECSSLLLSKKAKVIAIPELNAMIDDSELTHEAAIGKIAEEQIEYLMSRGIPKEEAISMIVRGFVDTRILGLPIEIEENIKRIISSITSMKKI